MGTNFYMLNDERTHIGKRSAAGMYCWDCHTTLCKAGEKGIHQGTRNHQDEWYDKCPSCGKAYKPESLEKSSVGVELGFAKRQSPHNGVTTVASFTWAIKPSRVLGSRTRIIDEYDNQYSNSHFRKMLRDMCPIEFFDSIGVEFS